MSTVFRISAVALIACAVLSGCSSTRRLLGSEKTAPDEFQVIARAPLSQPPDFTLRPPTPGVARPQEGTVRDQAKNVLLGTKSKGSSMFPGRSPGEQFLLTQAGADRALPDIRKKVNEETSALIEADKSFADKVIFWQTKPPPGEVVDASKEAKRLQENASLGKPPTEGQSPEIVRRKKGWLEGIF